MTFLRTHRRKRAALQPRLRLILYTFPPAAIYFLLSSWRGVSLSYTQLGDELESNSANGSGAGFRYVSHGVREEALGRLEGVEGDERVRAMRGKVDFRKAAIATTGGFAPSAEDELGRLLRTERAQELQKPGDGDRFLLFRALGNDLHERGRTLRHLRFVLENEPGHEGVGRRWLLNRIVRREDELEIVKVLVEYGERFTRDAVDLDEFASIDFNFESVRADYLHSDAFGRQAVSRQREVMDELMRDKRGYVLNGGRAMNVMIELAIAENATYVLPIDGSCFVSRRAWQSIRDGIAGVKQAVRDGRAGKSLAYFAVGTATVRSSELTDRDYLPSQPSEEPQLIFHRDAKERFSEDMRHGGTHKAQLLRRLGVTGAWDRSDPNDGQSMLHLVTAADNSAPNRSTGTVQSVGWVARLVSEISKSDSENNGDERATSYSDEVETLLAEAYRKWAESKLGFTEKTMMWYDEKALQANRDEYRRGNNPALLKLVQLLRDQADREMSNDAVYTVTHKSKAPPTGNLHDYISAAPYAWPNPHTPDGFPYIHRDGQRAPGTRLYSKDSDMYDRTRMASFTRNATVLALAGYFTGERRYYEKAAQQVRTWFIDRKTRMNPHLNYAQVRFKSRKGKGSKTGLIDFVNIAIVLDAVRILQAGGALSSGDMTALKDWMRQYNKFLSESKQATAEYRSDNNHGTLFDVQAASVSAFLGDSKQLLRHTSLAKLRMTTQFAKDGSMPREMVRETQLHYMMYGLQAWVWLARMSERHGVDMWNFAAEQQDGPLLKRGMAFCVPYFSRIHWSHPQDSQEDMHRMLFLYFHGRQKYPDLSEFSAEAELGGRVPSVPSSAFSAKPIFHDYFLVPPFWNLAMYPH